MAINLELWKAQRKLLKLDYQILAEKAGVSLNTIKNIFRGATTDPRIETVQRIEEALGIKKELPPSEMTEGEKAWIELYRTLTEENKDLLVKLVAAFKEMPAERRRFVLEAIRLAQKQ